MAGRILREDVDALRDQADAVAVIGDHTKLVRAGKRWKGLCPLHTEKTPSFTVDPTMNRWHCFGCGQGGDLYDFLQQVEGLSFVEAVEQLARRSGVTLRYEQLSAHERRSIGERTRLLAVTAAARQWFTQRLHSDEGEVARRYLEDRGFGRADADRFALGYAPNEWDRLTIHLTEQERIDRSDLLAVGLAKPNDRGGLRDTFRGRLVFPIRTPAGDVVGFGGRVLPGLDYGGFDPPKYLNSPETALYRKHEVLYGLHEGRSDVVRSEEVLVCEGYTDVMALHRAGFANAVATCGTAVGTDHLRLLARHARRIVLAFDGDAAGAAAARRAFDAAREVETESGDRRFSLRVLVLPDGLDPADLVARDGVDAVRAAVADAPDVVPFLVERVAADADLTSTEGRIAALHRAVELLGLEPDPERRRAFAAGTVAPALGVSLEFVQATAGRGGVDLDVHRGVARTALHDRRRLDVETGRRRAEAQRQRAVLRVALQEPGLLPDEWFDLEPDDFDHRSAAAVMRALRAAGGVGVPLTDVLAAAEDDEVRRVVEGLAFEEAVPPDTAASVADLVRGLLAARLARRRTQLLSELEVLNPDAEHARVVEVSRELARLEADRRRLLGGAA